MGNINCEITINANPVWRYRHFLPVVWPWFFDAGRITESHRLHDTVFEAAERFAARREAMAKCAYFEPLALVLAGVEADSFARAMNESPDAIISLDLGEFIRQRPYDHAAASAAWDRFFAACQRDDASAAMVAWERAVLNPLVWFGETQRDALALAARASELELPSDKRAEALVRLLIGEPVTRPAMALQFAMIEAARAHPAIAFRQVAPLWRRIWG